MASGTPRSPFPASGYDQQELTRHADRGRGKAANNDTEGKLTMTKTFCKHCGGSVRELDARMLAGMGPDADGREPQLGDWADLVTGIDCPGTDDRRHEPGDPVVYGDAPARQDTGGVGVGAVVTEIYWQVPYGSSAVGPRFDTHAQAWREARARKDEAWASDQINSHVWIEERWVMATRPDPGGRVRTVDLAVTRTEFYPHETRQQWQQRTDAAAASD